MFVSSCALTRSASIVSHALDKSRSISLQDYHQILINFMADRKNESPSPLPSLKPDIKSTILGY